MLGKVVVLVVLRGSAHMDQDLGIAEHATQGREVMRQQRTDVK